MRKTWTAATVGTSGALAKTAPIPRGLIDRAPRAVRNDDPMRMKLCHAAALAVVWFIIAQHSEIKELHLLPGVFIVPPATQYTTREACEKDAAQYQKNVPADTLLKCVKKPESN